MGEEKESGEREGGREKNHQRRGSALSLYCSPFRDGVVLTQWKLSYYRLEQPL